MKTLSFSACMALLSFVLGVSPASAQSRVSERCAADAEAGEELRVGHHLVDARARFRACADPACPDFVVRDCARWQQEVEALLPTIVAGARDDQGNDIAAATLHVDGLLRSERLAGSAIELDPGEHTFSFSAQGYVRAERHVVVREGEKSRILVVMLERSRTPPPMAPRSPSLWVWGLGASALVLGGIGVGLEIDAISTFRTLERGCGRTQTCERDDVDANRTTFWAANILLVSAAVALGGAAYLFLRQDPRTPTPARVARPSAP
jgi:hypothetical protein